MAISKRTNDAGRVIGWQVRIDRRDERGRRVRLTIGTYRTKKEAERAERKARDDQERGTFVDPSTVTVAEVLTTWLGAKAGTITANALQGYEIAARLHLTPALGSVKVQKLTASAVQRQYTAWLAGGMSPRMVHRCHNVLSQALGQAVRFGLVARTVCDDVELPRIERKELTVWTPEETAAFLSHAARDAWAALWYLLALEGMRRGEALGLRWGDLTWERGTAHIVQTVVADGANGGAALIQPRTKTQAGARTVKLTRQTLAVLEAHRDRQAFVRKAAGADWEDNDLILCTGQGRPLGPGNVTRAYLRLVILSGVPKIRVHDMRHGAASLMLRAGVPLKIVSEKLGHASVSITGDLYSHVAESMQDDAAEAVSAIIERASVS